MSPVCNHAEGLADIGGHWCHHLRETRKQLVRGSPAAPGVHMHHRTAGTAPEVMNGLLVRHIVLLLGREPLTTIHTYAGPTR